MVELRSHQGSKGASEYGPSHEGKREKEEAEKGRVIRGGVVGLVTYLDRAL